MSLDLRRLEWVRLRTLASSALWFMVGLCAICLCQPATATATPVAAPSSATPNGGLTAETAPSLELVDQTTWAAPNSQVTATVAYRGTSPGSSIRAALYDRVPTRSAFVLTMKGRSLSGQGRELMTSPTKGTSGQVTLEVAIDDGSTPKDPVPAPTETHLTLTRPGVYPLVFRLIDSNGTTLKTLVSYVIRLAAAPASGEPPSQQPLLVSTVLPLEAAPSHAPNGTTAISSTTRRAVEALVNGLNGAHEGRHAATTASLAFAITPELLEAFADSKDPRDRQLVTRLKNEIDGGELLPMPYVEIDLASWLAQSELAGRLDELRLRGVSTVSRVLGSPTSAVVDMATWSSPKTPRATAKGLTWLATQGATGVLLRPDDLDPLDESRFPRTLTRQFDIDLPGDASIKGVELDAELSRHFTAEDPQLGVNQLMADLAVLGLDLPALERGVVVSPPADWEPSAAFLNAYRRALASAHPTSTTPLINPTPLHTLFAELPVARAAGDTATRGPALHRTLATSQGTPSLSRAFVAGLTSATGSVVSLATTLPGGPSASTQVVNRFQRQLDVASSSALTDAEATRRFNTVESEINSLTSTVKIPDPQTITLTSHTAEIPFTIHRGANGPTVAKLSLDSGQRDIFPDGNERTLHLTRTTTQVRLRVRIDSPGDTIVRVRLTSPDGGMDLGDTRLVIRSTAVSGMGLVITFGSLAFLMLWWARDIIRRRRKRRAAHIPPAQLLDLDP